MRAISTRSVDFEHFCRLMHIPPNCAATIENRHCDFRRLRVKMCWLETSLNWRKTTKFLAMQLFCHLLMQMACATFRYVVQVRLLAIVVLLALFHELVLTP